MYKCQNCGKDDIRSKSGFSLHIQKCVVENEDETKYCMVGRARYEYHPKNVFELVIEEHIDPIDPKRYFMTSGEAIAKASKLEKDLWQAAGQARKLLKLLREARGDAKWLESSWNEERRLILKKKNPRKRRPKKNV